MKLLIISSLILAFVPALFAQDSAERTIVKEAKPKMPSEAKKSGLGGRVSVLVEIDQDGNVIAVNDVAGPDWVCPAVLRPDVIALRESARSSAMETKFAAASAASAVASLRLYFDFPTKEVPEKGGKDKYFSAVATPPDGAEKANPDGNKYTVKGDSAAYGDKNPPPDYIGPVAAAPSQTQKSSEAGSKSMSGGVLNGKASKLPRPSYPPAARAVRASGAVGIQVLIDQEGKVFSAMPVNGHPLLRSAARLAACQAEFSPTYLEGSPVKVMGVITYNFVP